MEAEPEGQCALLPPTPWASGQAEPPQVPLRSSMQPPAASPEAHGAGRPDARLGGGHSTAPSGIQVLGSWLDMESVWEEVSPSPPSCPLDSKEYPTRGASHGGCGLLRRGQASLSNLEAWRRGRGPPCAHRPPHLGQAMARAASGPIGESSGGAGACVQAQAMARSRLAASANSD